jgi:ATP-dependent DNA helicase RecG
MFRAMLIEEKNRRASKNGDAVKVLLIGGNLSAPFRAFVAEENQRGIELSVDHLLILQYLLAHPEIDTDNRARNLPTA